MIEEGLAAVAATVEPGARLLRAWPLPGGLSAVMTVLEVERPDGSHRRLVLRRARDSVSDLGSSAIVAEFGLLVRLRALGLPVPRPCRVDDSGVILSQPYSVLEYVEGSPRFTALDPAGTARVFAAQLAAIHQVDATLVDLGDLPRRVEAVGRRLAETGVTLDEPLCEGPIRRALVAGWPPPEPDCITLLHGDFWPGNVLWAEEEVVAVIDWEDAAVGDPLADVGTTRLDVLWAFGPRAMSSFTGEYLRLRPGDPATLPWWDLVAALRPAGAMSRWAADWAGLGRPDVTASTMRAAHRWFVDQALSRLAPG